MGNVRLYLRRWLLCAVVTAVYPAGTGAFESPATLKLRVAGKQHVGTPIAWGEETFVLLRRDGFLLQLPTGEITEATKVSDSFRPYPATLIQEHLQDTFRGRYEVTRTPHYVVVHPPGEQARWADPFEDLYARFHRYFRVRGFELAEPPFPMVVIVFATRREFESVAFQAGVQQVASYVGLYSPMSNRIVTFAQANRGTTGHWASNQLTLIHEALHQFAYNTGVHSRWSETPLWCSEGLAAMFEAPGINDSLRYSESADRLHPRHLRYLQDAIQKGRLEGRLSGLIDSDELFQQDPEMAYAMSWGLTYYLNQTRPNPYFQYLQQVAARPAFTAYPPGSRLNDFVAAFGNRLELLESQWFRFLSEQ